MAEDAEHFSKYLLSTYMSFLRMVIGPLIDYQKFWGFMCLIFAILFIFQILSLCLKLQTGKIFLCSLNCLVILLTVSFAVQSHWSILGIISCPIGSLISFELIFVKRQILLNIDIQFCQHYCLKKKTLLKCMFQVSLSKIR